METVNKLKLYYLTHQAWDYYGKEKQMRQLQEECAELIAAISHHFRGRDNDLEDIAEEIADTLIVINQLIYGLDLQEKLDRHMNIKLNLLDLKINQSWQSTK